MPVTDVQKDTDALTMTITSTFAATAERVWQLWWDPRQLERWWGPPTHPATVVEHDLSPGATVTYFMTGPAGEKYHGWWRIEAAEPPNLLRFEDGFADDEGKPSDSMPAMNVTVTIEEGDGRTTMAIESRFASREAMDQILEMGAAEGMREALGQIEPLLAEGS
jgi:uncharacterized protein YndB with AHSA1/START domain